MKAFIALIIICMITVAFGKPIYAQGNTSIASGLGLYVFPTNDQDNDQQDTDEVACYKWAKVQTGVDPINPPEVQAEQVDCSVDGTAVKSAAIGAVVGGFRGR